MCRTKFVPVTDKPVSYLVALDPVEPLDTPTCRTYVHVVREMSDQSAAPTANPAGDSHLMLICIECTSLLEMSREWKQRWRSRFASGVRAHNAWTVSDLAWAPEPDSVVRSFRSEQRLQLFSR